VVPRTATPWLCGFGPKDHPRGCLRVVVSRVPRATAESDPPSCRWSLWGEHVGGDRWRARRGSSLRTVFDVAAPFAMRCGICHFVAPVDGTGRTARTFSLRQTLCRRSLPCDHSFSDKGQCGHAKCVHHKISGDCGLTGHRYGTQTYAFDRWKLTDGRLLRRNSNRALEETDFVCVLMADATVRNLVNNTQSVSAAAAQVSIERRRNVSRLRAHTRAEGVGLDESVRLIQSLGSPAALLQGDSKVALDALVAARDEGAVAANCRAADAVESDVDGDDGRGASQDDELDCNVDEDADEDEYVHTAAFSSRGKRVKALRGPSGGRIGLYAAAISKGKAPRDKRKGKALKDSKAEVKPLLPDAVDLESLWPRGTRQPRSRPRTVVKSTSVFACSELLVGPCSCLKKQNSCAKNRSTPLDRLSEPISCLVLAYLCLLEHESCLPPHIAPASRATDASPSLSLSRRVRCIRLMLCLSFYEWRCIDAGEKMLSAPFWEKPAVTELQGGLQISCSPQNTTKQTCF